jgi:hypothetical protein
MTSTAAAFTLSLIHHRSGKSAWEINGENKPVLHCGIGLTLPRMTNTDGSNRKHKPEALPRTTALAERAPTSSMAGPPGPRKARPEDKLTSRHPCSRSMRWVWMAGTGPAKTGEGAAGLATQFPEVRMGTLPLFLRTRSRVPRGGRGVCGLRQNESLWRSRKPDTRSCVRGRGAVFSAGKPSACRGSRSW